MFFYNFIGDKYIIDSNQENNLLLAFKKAFIEDKEEYCQSMSLNLYDINDTDDFCSHVFKKLNSLKKSRNCLTKYR